MPWLRKLHAREDLMESALRLLEHDETRVLTLTGLPGAGTTSVARALAARHDAGQDAGQEATLVDARRAMQPGTLARLVLEAAAVSDLVVVDDADHVPAAYAELTQVLKDQPDARLLLTASAPLQLLGELVVRVPPLPEPDLDADTEELAAEPAIRLFIDAAERSGATATFDGETLRDIAAICMALGGIPQAIVMAAARTPTLSPATLRDLLSRSSPSTIITSRTTERDHDLFTAIAWSESLLDAASRALLADLTVFHSPVPLEAIEAVAPRHDLIDCLSTLVNTHLVEPVHDDLGSRYRLPPLVRERATHLLTGEPDRILWLRSRHTRWAVAVATTSRELDAAGSPTAALHLVSGVEPEIVAALRRAVEVGHSGNAIHLVLGITRFWFNGGATPTELGWIEQVTTLAKARACASADLAMLLAWGGAVGVELANDTAHVSAAAEQLGRARQLAEEVGGRVHVHVLMLTVQASRTMGDRSTIEPLCARAREAAQELDDQAALVSLEAWTAMIAHQRGAIDEALRWGRASFERARRLDDPQLLLAPAGLLRTLPPGTSGPGGTRMSAIVGVPTFTQLLDTARRSGDQRAVAWLLPSASVVAVHSGDLMMAAGYSIEALRRARASGSPLRSLTPLIAVILLAQAEGDLHVVQELQEAVRPFEPVLLPTLPPWTVQTYHDQIFPQGAKPTTPVGAGAMADVELAVRTALDYARSVLRPSVVHLAPHAVQPGAWRHELEELTEREQEVLGHLTSGASNKELSKQLGISTKTVMHHTSSIYRKQGVRGRSEAVAWALRHHLHDTTSSQHTSGATGR